MTADPFSEILDLANPQSIVSGGFVAGGTWGLRFPAMDKLSFSVQLRGGCWLSVEGLEKCVPLRDGDICLIAAGRRFTLASGPGVASVAAEEIFPRAEDGFVHMGSGEDCLQMGGFVKLEPASGGSLAAALPPVILVGRDSPHAGTLRWVVDLLIREHREGRPGSSLASAQLAQLMFVLVLRSYLESADPSEPGWLSALSDRKIAPALRLIHGDPARPWRLEELARASAMSRTSFATRFKQAAGVPPLTYLHEWRMRLAERALRGGQATVSEIAERLGYASDSAFSHAFKRTAGISPRRYREKIRDG